MSNLEVSIEQSANQPPEFQADSEIGQQILRQIDEAPPLDEGALDDKLEYPQTPEDRLQKKTFIDMSPYQDAPVEAFLRAAKEHPIRVPVNNIVNAHGFKSWLGRPDNYRKTRSTDAGYVSETSLETIMHYADTPTEAPPIDVMEMFIQPDGKIIFSNKDDGSHRLAAAVAKGQQTVAAYAVRIHRLDQKLL